MRGIVIAGTYSGCGKTTVTLGILAALKNKGLKVQPFKVGPDFIDTGLHRLVIDRPSRNLDLWMCGEDYVKECFYRYSADVDLSVVEGVMGMYDGEFSTAWLAGFLNIPVILVIDAYGMAESAGALIKGFRDWGLGISIAGIIFNRVASENHFQRLKDSVHDVLVLGYLPRNLDFEIPHRHLGLTVAEEEPISAEKIDKLADTILKYVDVEKIIKGLGFGGWGLEASLPPISNPHSLIPKIKIAVAYDKAFCFYYEDNLDLLREAGAEIVPFSPLYDSHVPLGVDAVYIGGGYPELYADALSKNKSMLEATYIWSLSGKPFYAECGGLMYLSKGIYGLDGKFYEMAGILPFETIMKKQRVRLGYREIMLKEDCILGKKGDRVRGHEFHYSEIKDSNELQVTSNELKTKYSSLVTRHSSLPSDSSLVTCYSLLSSNQDEGYRFKNTLASYVHIHFGSNPQIPRSFVKFCMEA